MTGSPVAAPAGGTRPARRVSLGVRLAWVLGVLGLAPALLMLVWFFSNPQLRSGEPWWLLSVVLVVAASLAVAIMGAFGLARVLTWPLNVLRDDLRDVELESETPTRLTVVPGSPDEVVEVRTVVQTLLDNAYSEARARRVTTAALLHDLKTPLLATEHTLMAILDDAEPLPWDKMRPILEMTLVETRALGDEVAQVVDAYRYGALGLRLTREDVQVETLVADVLAALEPVAAARDVRMEQVGSVVMRVDPRALRSAVQNLVANAVVKAARLVTVRVMPDELWIEDDGPGLPAPLDVLTRPYDISTFETSVQQVSTGLGLSIARSVAEAHGGGLRLERSGPEGTTLVLEIGRDQG